MAAKPHSPGSRLERLPSVGMIDPYPLTSPEMGHAVIVNTLKTELPRTLEDVTAIKHALETVGFIIKCYGDCTRQQMKSIKDEILKEERHKLANCLFLILVCHHMDQGWILDKNRKRSFTFGELTSGLDGISTLHGKPKIIIIQQLVNETGRSDEDSPVESKRKDFYIVKVNFSSTSDTGKSFLEEFSTQLVEYHMSEALETIFEMTEKTLSTTAQVPALTESDLMNLAGKLSSTAMQIIAVSKLDNLVSEIGNLSSASREDVWMMNFKILDRWKNRNPSNNRKKLAEILGDTDGLIDGLMVKSVLNISDKETVRIRQFNDLTHHLYFSEFRKQTVAPITANHSAEYERTIQQLKETVVGLEKRLKDMRTEYERVLEENKKLKRKIMTADALSSAERTSKPIELDDNETHRTRSSASARDAKGNKINVKLLRTVSVGEGWKPGFAVMTSRKILMSLRRAIDQLHTLYLFSQEGKVEKKFVWICTHEVEQYLLAVKTDKWEMLAFSCPHCQAITLMSLGKGDTTHAYKGEWVGRMCHGGENKIFVQAKKNEILELKVDPDIHRFTKTNTIHSGVQSRYSGLCFVPSPPGFLIVADNSDKPKVRAVDCSPADKGVPSIAWTFSEEVDGKKICPESVVYSPEKDVIIVSDGVNSRLLVIDGKEGMHAQTIELPGMNVVDMHLRGDELVLLHSSGDEYNISYLSLK